MHRWKKGSGGADASAEDTLWTHQLAWNRRWQGHEEELRYKPSGNPSDAYVAGEGTSFIMAVAIGQVWLPNDTKLRRLLQLTVTAEQRRQAEQYLDGWEARPWSIQYIPVREGEFDIVKYHVPSEKSAEENYRSSHRAAVGSAADKRLHMTLQSLATSRATTERGMSDP